jgi:glucose/arabinose dehydrogenase
VLLSAGPARPDGPTPRRGVLTGREALGDWTTDAPGVRRKVAVEDLTKPYDTPSAENHPKLVERPEGARPKAPEGFEVAEFAAGLKQPRVIVRAPNGDLFVAESKADRIRVLRDADGDGTPERSVVFADDLDRPFGIAFSPPGPEPRYVYVGNTGSVVRFPYRDGDLEARGEPETLVDDIPSGSEEVGGGGHWTRDLAFSRDGKTLFVSVGSRSNVDDDERERRRACILAFDPDGTHERTYASGLRNAVGLAVHPRTGALWASVNERDELGDDLVPDYVTRVREGGFYGWPWYYLGPHQDPRHAGKHPELKDKVLVPDVLLQAHSASLDMTFYDGEQFPRVPPGRLRRRARLVEPRPAHRLQGDPHPVARRPGDRRVRGLPRRLRHAGGDVWGRPVGVAVAKDGALMVTDDGSNTVWRVSYTGRGKPPGGR